MPVAPGWARAIERAEAYFSERGQRPTAVQRAAFEALPSGDDLLLVAPTGSGKTVAAMLPLMAHLCEVPADGRGVRVLYIAPLRALVMQQRAVLEDLALALCSSGVSGPAITVGTRSGDSTQAERAALLRAPPAVLLVTPESLALMLATRTREILSTVCELVLDEVHLLAEGKRGALLAATLETLSLAVSRAARPRPRRIGLSATAHPTSILAAWLGGQRPARTLVAGESLRPRIEIAPPALEGPYPSVEWTWRRLLPEVARAVASCEGPSLVFVRSRPRAERWTQALRDVLPARMPVACYHGSMAADERALVAQRLARGEVRAVVATSSLEVGVDVPGAAQVLLLSAPASVTRLLQSAGRSDHRPGGAPVARLFASNAPDLVCALAALRCASRGEIEPVHPREGDLDVLVQAVLGLCALGPTPRDALAGALRRAAPFAKLEDRTLDEVLDYLATGGSVLDAYPEAHRVIETDAGWVLSGPRSHRAYLRGVGTIVEDPAVPVRTAGRAVGSVDGRFAALLEPGDRFALAGLTWRVIDRRSDALEVVRERDRRGPAACWLGARLAQSELLTEECAALYAELDALVPAEAQRNRAAREACVTSLAARWSLAPASAAALVDLACAQREFSAIPTPTRFVVELLRERGLLHVVAHTFAGANANEVIGRVLAARMRAATGAGAEVNAADAGVVVTTRAPRGGRLPSEQQLREWLDPSGLERDLEGTLEGSSLARALFREVARIAQLWISDARSGSASPQLLYDVLCKNAPEHLLLRALAQTLWRTLDGERAARVLNAAQHRHWHVSVARSPSALAIPLFAQGARDRVEPEDLESALVEAAHALYARYGGAELP